MPLLPVADVLLIERRTCRCGRTVEVASPHPYRLFKACLGEPDKTVIRSLKRRPEKASEQEDLTPLSDRVVHFVEVHQDHCEECWTATRTFASAVADRPPAPAQHTTFSLAWTKAQSEATGKKPKAPAVIPFSIEEL